MKLRGNKKGYRPPKNAESSVGLPEINEPEMSKDIGWWFGLRGKVEKPKVLCQICNPKSSKSGRVH